MILEIWYVCFDFTEQIAKWIKFALSCTHSVFTPFISSWSKSKNFVARRPSKRLQLLLRPAAMAMSRIFLLHFLNNSVTESVFLVASTGIWDLPRVYRQRPRPRSLKDTALWPRNSLTLIPPGNVRRMRWGWSSIAPLKHPTITARRGRGRRANSSGDLTSSMYMGMVVDICSLQIFEFLHIIFPVVPVLVVFTVVFLGHLVQWDVLLLGEQLVERLNYFLIFLAILKKRGWIPNSSSRLTATLNLCLSYFKLLVHVLL